MRKRGHWLVWWILSQGTENNQRPENALVWDIMTKFHQFPYTRTCKSSRLSRSVNKEVDRRNHLKIHICCVSAMRGQAPRVCHQRWNKKWVDVEDHWCRGTRYEHQIYRKNSVCTMIFSARICMINSFVWADYTHDINLITFIHLWYVAYKIQLNLNTISHREQITSHSQSNVLFHLTSISGEYSHPAEFAKGNSSIASYYAQVLVVERVKMFNEYITDINHMTLHLASILHVPKLPIHQWVSYVMALYERDDLLWVSDKDY